MAFPTSKVISFILFTQLIPFQLVSGGNFPATTDLASFKADLYQSALISNIPNTPGSDSYTGVNAAFSGFRSVTGDYYFIPAVRLSVYPNPGYNLWAQFAAWPEGQAGFSVGTGIQVTFQGENLRNGQALGISWNTIYGNGYSQRDISVHGLLTRFAGPAAFGVMAVYNMHHVLVTDINGFRSYDETIVVMIPYISWTVSEVIRVSLNSPLGTKGAAFSAAIEWLIGKRE